MYDRINSDDVESLCNKIQQITINNNNVMNHDTNKIIHNYFNQGIKGQEILLNTLINRRIIKKDTLLLIDGLIFDYLMLSQNQQITDKLNSMFSYWYSTIKIIT